MAKLNCITLYWDTNTEEGNIKTLVNFEEMYPLLKVDFLKDVIYHLEELYEKSHDELRKEFVKEK